MLLEIGFIEEMKTTRGNKEVPQTFSQFPFFAKIQFNPFDFVHWQASISPFCDITKN